MTPPATNGPPPPLVDLLSGRTPMFIVHKGQHAAGLPKLLDRATRRVGSGAGVGIAIRLPRHRPPRAKAFLTGCSPVLKIADPEIYTIPGTGSPDIASMKPSGSASHHPYMAAVPAAPDPAWVRQVLDAQYDAGATVLLSASGWVGSTQARQALDNAMDWVTQSRAALGADDPMFVNLTLDTAWLTNRALRDMLIEEFAESTESLWWLRFRWPVVDRYAQLTDVAMLDAYREIAQAGALEDKVIVFPNSGLTGWMATAWGGQGFSTGIGWPEQAFAAERGFGGQPGQPPPPPIERYFDTNVLHTMPRTDHQAISTHTGYVACRCPYSRDLSTGPWNAATAGLHYLMSCARLTASLSGQHPGLRARQHVRDARTFVQSLPAPLTLTGQASPRHLPLWASRLP